MDYLYMDSSAILHANRAGGTTLLDKYAQLARAKGLELAITDVVWDELFVGWKGRGPPPEVKLSTRNAELAKWLSKNAVELTTQERRLIDDFRAGRLAKYVWDDRGERSIVEHLLSKSEPHKSAVLVDDIRFHNKLANWARKSINFNAEKILFTNPDLLVSACKERMIHVQQYERLVGAFRTHCAPFNKNLPGTYSAALDGRFREKSEVQRLRAGKPVRGARILGAFGRLMAVTGIAFVAIDTMTTAAHAATQLRDGDSEGAAETVAEFGGRMAGAMIGAEEGVLLGAALGSIVPGLGTTVGAIAGGAIGGALGATIGEQAAKDMLAAIRGEGHPPLDERLADSTMRDYREPEVRALQNDLYEAGYSTEEVNYVCASLSAARDVSRPGDDERDLRDTLGSFAERVELGVHAAIVDRVAPAPEDSVKPPVEPDGERVAVGDDAAAAPDNTLLQTDPGGVAEVAPVGPESNVPAPDGGEDQRRPSNVSADTSRDALSSGARPAETDDAAPPRQMPDTGRAEPPPKMPDDSNDAPVASKLDDHPEVLDEPPARVAPSPDTGRDAPAPDARPAETDDAAPPRQMPDTGRDEPPPNASDAGNDAPTVSKPDDHPEVPGEPSARVAPSPDTGRHAPASDGRPAETGADAAPPVQMPDIGQSEPPPNASDAGNDAPTVSKPDDHPEVPGEPSARVAPSPDTGRDAPASDVRPAETGADAAPPVQMPDIGQSEAPPNAPGDVGSTRPASMPGEPEEVPGPRPVETGADAVPPPVGQTPSNVSEGSSDAPAPLKSEDRPPPAEIVPTRDMADGTAPANEALDEVSNAGVIHPTNVEPGGQAQRRVSDPLPSPVPDIPFDETTFPLPPQQQPGAAAPVNGTAPQPDLKPDIDVIARREGRADERGDSLPADGQAEPRCEDPKTPADVQPVVAGSDLSAGPVSNEVSIVQLPPSGDEALDDEMLKDVTELCDDEAVAAGRDEVALDAMMAGLGDDRFAGETGLAELRPLEADETLTNEGVESLVVTGVLLTPLDGSDHPSETPVVPDDEFLQDIGEIGQDEAHDMGGDQAVIDDMSDELLPADHETLTGNDFRGAGDLTGGPPWAGDDGTPEEEPSYPGDDVPGYGDDDDHRWDEDDSANDGSGSSTSSDDDDE